MSEWLPFVERLGLPVMILAVIAYALWKVAKWAAPMAQSVVEKHVKFVDALETNSAKTADSIEVLSKAIELQGEQTGQMLMRLGDGVVSLGRALGKDTEATGLRNLPAELRALQEEAARRRNGR